MVPLRGWGLKGERVRSFTPHGRWRTRTFLGALRCDRLTAPCLFGGQIIGECFRANVQQVLVPQLQSSNASGQSRQPQVGCSPQLDQRRRRTALVSAAILSRAIVRYPRMEHRNPKLSQPLCPMQSKGRSMRPSAFDAPEDSQLVICSSCCARTQRLPNCCVRRLRA